MLTLPQITLVAVTSVAIEATLRALRESMAQVRFGAALLLSDVPPSADLPVGFEWRPIAPLASRTDYSRFLLHELAGHIATDFALVTQWDGYVLNGANWRDEFFGFDYVGAPWPHFTDGRTVGNGGFSLRSRGLMAACRTLPFDPDLPEDIAICRTFGARLEAEHGIRFAPEAVAARFAHERGPLKGGEFGFHGVFNMIRRLPRREFDELLAGLEPGLLGRRERGDVMRAALARGQWRSLLTAWRHRRHR